jgi:hypothetical protein
MEVTRLRHALTAAAVSGAPALAVLPSTGSAAAEPLEATRTRDGVGMTMTLGGPLVAGQPTAVRGSMWTSLDDGWGNGGYGVRSVLGETEFIHLMGDDTVVCP